MAPVRRLLVPLALLALSGCCFFEDRGRIDREVEQLSMLVDDLAPHRSMDPPPPATPAEKATLEKPAGAPAAGGEPLQPVVFQQPDQPEKKTLPPKRLIYPPELPGADQAPLQLPRDKAERAKVLKELFPPTSKVPPLPQPAQGPEGHPLDLADLQRLAATYSPNIKNAIAAVEAAKGAVKQAGAYPNPTVFFEQDTVGTGPGGYEGLGFNQVVKTGNKLTLQQAAAMMDFLNARLALRRAYTDLAYQVRGYYFAVLVARENVKISDALFRFTDEVYRIQVEYVETGFAAEYEPIQLRTLVDQVRISLIQAQNQYLASWQQLAAAIGLREMCPTELEGRVDMPIPRFEYCAVLTQALKSHTDVLTALNSIQKAKFNLEFAKVTPLPDVALNVLVQKDYTAAPNLLVHSLQFALPLPVWDQNLGNIKQAEGQLAQALAGPEQARNNLTNTLADAYNRYLTSRLTVEISLRQVRDQVRAYRGLYERRQQLPGDVTFGDVVTAQQTLAGYLQAYVAALGQQWQAVVDVANVLQTDDLFQVGPQEEVAPVLDLEHLNPNGVPSCGPLSSAQQHGAGSTGSTTAPSLPDPPAK